MILKPPLFAKPAHGHPLGPDGGLCGYWPMNEGRYNKDFTKVFDVSGNGYDGTFTGTVDWVSGKFGSAIQILSNENVTLPLNAYDMGIRRHATFVLFFRIVNSVAENRYMFSDYNSSKGFAIRIDNAAGVSFFVYPNNHRVTVAHTFVINRDYMLVGVMDGPNMYLYLDGVYLDSALLGEDIGDSISPIRIGVRGDLDGTASHIVHFGSIYNRALSASEIALLYLKPFCMFERDPIELWSAATLGAAVEGPIVSPHCRIILPHSPF